MFRSLFENSNIDVLETTIHPPSSTPHLSPANLSFSPEVTITNNHLVNRLLIWGVIYHHMYLWDKLKRPQGHLEKFGPPGEQWDGEPGWGLEELNCHFILCKTSWVSVMMHISSFMSWLQDEFKTLLKTAGCKLVVVEFSAKWCGPCKRIYPLVHVSITSLCFAVLEGV